MPYYKVVASQVTGRPLPGIKVIHEQLAHCQTNGVPCIAPDIQTYTGRGGITTIDIPQDKPHWFKGLCERTGELVSVQSVERIDTAGRYYTVDLVFKWP